MTSPPENNIFRSTFPKTLQISIHLHTKDTWKLFLHVQYVFGIWCFSVAATHIFAVFFPLTKCFFRIPTLADRFSAWISAQKFTLKL